MIARRPAAAVAALALSALLGLPASARADAIDVGLVREVWTIQKYLADHNVKNVGTLTFRVQKGAGKESFSLGTICTSLPFRLENALIVTNHPTTPVGVVRNATAVTAAYKVAWHTKPDHRAKLFAVKEYPLAWGQTRVGPDAFLTGKIKVSEDLSKLVVTVEAILKGSPEKLEKVCEFEVKTDRDALRELGQSFAAPRGGVARSVAARNTQAVADARRRDLAPGTDLTADNVSGIKFQILYDDVVQVVRPDSLSPGELRVDEPQEGQKVSFLVSNNGTRDHRLGLSIRINGRSVWSQAEGPISSDTGIWLFDPNKPATPFTGFITDVAGQNVIPFKVLSKADSAAREAEFGEKCGIIDLDVLESEAGGEPEGEVMSISRGVPRSVKPAAKAKSSEDLRKDILGKNPLLKKFASASATRGLIVGDEASVTGPPVETSALPNAKKIGRLSIRYYDPHNATAAMQISK